MRGGPLGGDSDIEKDVGQISSDCMGTENNEALQVKIFHIVDSYIGHKSIHFVAVIIF